MLQANSSNIKLNNIGNGVINIRRIALGKLVGSSGEGKPLLKRLASHSLWDRLRDCVTMRVNTSITQQPCMLEPEYSRAKAAELE